MLRTVLSRRMILVALIAISPIGTCFTSHQTQAQMIRFEGTGDVTGRDVFGTQFPLGSGDFTLDLSVDPIQTAVDNAGQQTWSSAFFDFTLNAPASGFPRGGMTLVNTITAAREGEPNADFINFFVGNCSSTMCGFPIGTVGNETEALGFEGMFGGVTLPDGALGTGPFSDLGAFVNAAAALDVETATDTVFNASWVPACLLGGGGGCEDPNGPGDIRFLSVDGTITDISLGTEGLPGDYNNDGVVNAADYVVWRNREGEMIMLPNERPDAMTPGVVDDEDYAFWVDNFGDTLGSGSGTSAAVPEPGAISLLLISTATIGSFCFWARLVGYRLWKEHFDREVENAPMNGHSVFFWCIVFTITTGMSSRASAAIQLSSNPTAGLGAQLFRISPDSSRVVYTGEMNAAGITELFSAPTDQAGLQIQLNGAPVFNGEVSPGIALTPNGTTVVYSGDLGADQQFELFSASTTSAGTQVKLNDAPAHLEIVTNQFKFTPDGMQVIYRSDLDTDNAFELYVATIGSTGTQIRLTNAPVDNGDVSVNDYFPTSDGTHVVFLGDMDTNDVDELYGAPLNSPGMQIKLNNVSAINGDIDDDFLLTSDGGRVVYRGALDTLFRNDLYSALTDQSGTQIKLNGPTVAGNSGVNSLFRLTPGGDRVMYAGVLDSAGVTELYSAPTDQANMQVKLNDTPVEDGDVGAHFMTPDGTRAVFRGDLLVDTRQDLFSAPIDTAGQQIQLNTNTAGGSVGQPIMITPDSSRVIYPGQMNVLGQTELYSAPTDAENLQITLTTNPLGDDGGMGTYTVSPDGTRVAYTGIFTTVGIFDLYVASTTASGTQVALTNLTAGENVLNTTFTPDGQFVIYGLDTDGNFSQDELYAADALGQNPPVQISDPLIDGRQITQFLVTPDSQKVIYRANQDDLSIFNLFAASLPGTSDDLPGDYNDDGVVNAADYVVFRDNLSSDMSLPNDDTAGVAADDYDRWAANFGAMLGSGAGELAAVPEPATARLLMLVLLLAFSKLLRARGMQQ